MTKPLAAAVTRIRQESSADAPAASPGSAALDEKVESATQATQQREQAEVDIPKPPDLQQTPPAAGAVSESIDQFNDRLLADIQAGAPPGGVSEDAFNGLLNLTNRGFQNVRVSLNAMRHLSEANTRVAEVVMVSLGALGQTLDDVVTGSFRIRAIGGVLILVGAVLWIVSIWS